MQKYMIWHFDHCSDVWLHVLQDTYSSACAKAQSYDMEKHSPHLVGGVRPWLGQQRPEVCVIKQQRLPKALVAQLRTLAYI